MVLHEDKDEAGALREIAINVHLPPDFPERYVQPVLRAAEQCSVKKLLAAHPPIVVRAETSAAESA